MIRERPNLFSDGTVDGTYWTRLCPRCVERHRAEAVVVMVSGEPVTLPDDFAAPPLLDWQRFLIERKATKR